jgi:hypothetical protein
MDLLKHNRTGTVAGTDPTARSLTLIRERDRARSVSRLVAMILILSMMHLVVIGSLGPLRDDASLVTLRVETLRAFYAAEVGAQVVMRATLDGSEPPAEGTEVLLANGSVIIREWPSQGAGRVVVEGRSGHSIRRVALELE